MLTTRSLLVAAAAADVIHVDATYKLNWQGYPVLIAGVTDAASQFFPCIFAVMTSEKEGDYTSLLRVMKDEVEKATQQTFAPRVVMGDCAEAVTRAAEAVFPDAARRVCWFHVKKAIDGRLRGEDKEWRGMVLGDLEKVQLSATPEQFDHSFDLMCERWLSSSWPSACDFVTYIRTQYRTKNSGWFEGFDLRSPSTNNAIESFNGQIKARHTIRERAPVGRFLRTALDMVSEWAAEHGERRVFQSDPPVHLSVQTAAWQWITKGQRCFTSGARTYVPAGDRESVSRDEALHYDEVMSGSTPVTFGELMQVRFSTWLMEDRGGEGTERSIRDLTCTCPPYLKKSMCKHVVAAAITAGWIMVSERAKDVPLGQKRKRGRPALARPALLH
ncbi:uncharacterized protein LOC122394085 [Amphibalanus amphitrite]|uniref:uncharacterized protein LOC122394085 n=1 Tax=Amphibalanus amphitrite TaxID=1232801 RepID=UPI001C9204D3|nr:uncharacterized protein LOC122394085 [Amphibalanus amphitrite]